ncbi:MAG: CRISPR-associated endonuclease Cas2 [Chloroflexi bacterium]|nr:CRISPR-associated endonuclease Cas2 [Chloroflexota bacterium]
MTTVLLLYDIPHDGTRAKVADACLDYGLARVQYSAFLGELNHNRQQEILLRLRRIIGQRPARIQLVPVCEKDLRLMKEVVTDDYRVDR